MDVRLPDGTVIKNVPDGTSKAALLSRLKANGIAVSDSWATQPTDEHLQKVVMQMESGGNANAVSPKGAIGAMQTMRPTMEDPGFGVEPARKTATGAVLPGEPERVGRDYLQAMSSRYSGDPVLAMAAYNAGPGAVDSWLKAHGDPRTGAISPTDWAARIPYDETRKYVTRGTKELSVLRSRETAAADQAAFEKQVRESPASEMGAGERFLAGIGQGMTNVGRGLGQVLGVVSRGDVAAARKIDEPLLSTLGGGGGAVLGNIAATLPVALVPGAATLPGGVALGAASGFAQPSASTRETVLNTGLGGVLGGAVPAAVGGARWLKGRVAELLPDTWGGAAARETALGKMLLETLPKGAAPKGAVAELRESAKASTPGVARTTAEAAPVGTGLPALAEAAAARYPEVGGKLAQAELANIRAQRAAMLESLEVPIKEALKPRVTVTGVGADGRPVFGQVGATPIGRAAQEALDRLSERGIRIPPEVAAKIRPAGTNPRQFNPEVVERVRSLFDYMDGAPKARALQAFADDLTNPEVERKAALAVLDDMAFSAGAKQAARTYAGEIPKLPSNALADLVAQSGAALGSSFGAAGAMGGHALFGLPGGFAAGAAGSALGTAVGEKIGATVLKNKFNQRMVTLLSQALTEPKAAARMMEKATPQERTWLQNALLRAATTQAPNAIRYSPGGPRTSGR